MAPEDHIAWLADNAAWFGAIDPRELSDPVPNCPGWTVEDVFNHLALGVGLGYPAAMHTPTDQTFTGLNQPADAPTGSRAIKRFVENFGHCVTAFTNAKPDSACYTYAGPGQAKFWFRRAAVETSIHRIDVAEALGRPHHVSDQRLADAIVETAEFALPLAADIAGAPDGPVSISSPNINVEARLTHPTLDDRDQEQARIAGPGVALLQGLWGRERRDLDISGDHRVARQWLALAARAFGTTR